MGIPRTRGLLYSSWQTLGIPSAIKPIGQLPQFPPSPIPGDLGRGPSHQSTCSNIETRMDRTKYVVRVITGAPICIVLVTLVLLSPCPHNSGLIQWAHGSVGPSAAARPNGLRWKKNLKKMHLSLLYDHCLATQHP